jgi:hypothetical protein
MKDLMEFLELLAVVIGIPFTLFVLVPLGFFWLVSRIAG